MTYLLKMNVLTAHETGVAVPDGTPDSVAGLKENNVYTLVRNVPEGVTAAGLSRQTDLAAMRGANREPPRYVWDFAELPKCDGQHFPGPGYRTHNYPRKTDFPEK